MARKGDASPYGKRGTRRGTGWLQRESAARAAEREGRAPRCSPGRPPSLACFGGRSQLSEFVTSGRGSKRGHPTPLPACTQPPPSCRALSRASLRSSFAALPASLLPARLSQACCCVLDEVGKLGAEAPRRGRGEKSCKEPLLPLGREGCLWRGLDGGGKTECRCIAAALSASRGSVAGICEFGPPRGGGQAATGKGMWLVVFSWE